MKIIRIIIPLFLCLLLSCSIRVKPYPATKRLTDKVPVTFGIDLSQIPETQKVGGSACIKLMALGNDTYEVHLKDAFKSGAEYSFIDFADKVETINDTALSKKYELLYQPSLTEFTVSPFIAARINVKVKILNSQGMTLIDKEITGESKKTPLACVMSYIGNIFLQNVALEMSVKSAFEDYYEQLYNELITNPELKKLQVQKEPESKSDKVSDRKVTVVLKDGSEIIGVITSQNENTLIIKTAYTTVKIKKDKVEIINYNK